MVWPLSCSVHVDDITESLGSRVHRLAGRSRVNRPCFLSLCPEVSVTAFSRAVCQSCHLPVADTKTLRPAARTPWDRIMLTRVKNQTVLYTVLEQSLTPIFRNNYPRPFYIPKHFFRKNIFHIFTLFFFYYPNICCIDAVQLHKGMKDKVSTAGITNFFFVLHLSFKGAVCNW